MELLGGIFIYLVAAAIAVPVASRLGLGSVLGYLLAGVALGPALGLISDEADDMMHATEFGVVMMLFLIGLELRPKELWRMRADLLGLGGGQVLASIALLAGVAFALGLDPREAIVVGMVLALSSTAIVLQTLKERGLQRRAGGRSAFGVLLFQDIAVIPILALLPLLAIGDASHPADAVHHGGGALEGLPGWVSAAAIVGVISAIVLAGRFLAYPVFRYIALSGSSEVFTAAALALVIGVSLLMEAIGLSHALGAFIAGVVLSGSEYRHQLESDIEPFKGLLLGVFFISVGAGVDFSLLADQTLLVIAIAVGTGAIKAAVLWGLGTIFGLPLRDRWLFTLALPQAGEFGFVLIVVATGLGALGAEVAALLTLAIAITMFATPLFFILYERVIAPWLSKTEAEREPDDIQHEGPVIIAGVGRFGQIINRLLRAQGIETVILDSDARQLDLLRRFGVRAYYGDVGRPDLLEAAGIDRAQVFVATLGDPEKQVRLVETVRQRWPHVRVIARAYDRTHLYRLRKAGAHYVIREMLGSSLEAGREVLQMLGAHPFTAERQMRAFRAHDVETVNVLEEFWTNDFASDSEYVLRARDRTAQLEAVMGNDDQDDRHAFTSAWRVPGGEKDTAE